MPDDASIDDIIYRSYVFYKVKKGMEAINQNKVISADDLKKELEKW
jgi:hypothetical protein